MSKNKNTDTLINILKNTKNSLSAGQLSEMLNVSKRTVRNYIADINQNSDYYITYIVIKLAIASKIEMG